MNLSEVNIKLFIKYSRSVAGKLIEIKKPPEQSAENRRKECHRFWLRLLHTVILISNIKHQLQRK